MNKKLIEELGKLVTEKRFDLFKSVLDDRTKYLTIAIEDIYQSHNASAVLRSCDCFGIQDVHIIEDKNKFMPNSEIAMGSSKWLSLNKYHGENSTINAITNLRENGYRIVATTPHTNDINLEEFDITKGKTALFFGTELNGLTKQMLDNADEYLKIPMYGFTESFNISVSAAITLHHLRHKLNNSDIKWQLSTDEKDEILLNWLKKSIKKSDMIIERILAEKKQ